MLSRSVLATVSKHVSPVLPFDTAPIPGLLRANGVPSRLPREILRLVANDLAFDHVDHILGNIGSLVGDALEVSRG